MKIEKAASNDCSVLTELTKKSKAYWGYSEEQILKWKDNLTISKEYIENNNTFKLTIENKVLGYYSYIIYKENYVKLDNFFLLPDCIGKGFGNILMIDFLKRIKQESFEKIILNSEPNAENFYLKFGFRKIGEFETSIKNRFMPIMEMKL